MKKVNERNFTRALLSLVDEYETKYSRVSAIVGGHLLFCYLTANLRSALCKDRRSNSSLLFYPLLQRADRDVNFTARLLKTLEGRGISFYFEKSVTKASPIERQGQLVKYALSEMVKRTGGKWIQLLEKVCLTHNETYVTPLGFTPNIIASKSFVQAKERLLEKFPGKYAIMYDINPNLVQKYPGFKFEVGEKCLADSSRYLKETGSELSRKPSEYREMIWKTVVVLERKLSFNARGKIFPLYKVKIGKRGHFVDETILKKIFRGAAGTSRPGGSGSGEPL